MADEYGKDRQLLQDKADFDALNDLRSAMYESELKSFTVLQTLNGGGLALLVTFFAKTGLPKIPCFKYLIVTSIIFFIIGFLFSVNALFNYPEFLEKRYFRKIKKFRQSRSLYMSITFFILAIIMIVISLMKFN